MSDAGALAAELDRATEEELIRAIPLVVMPLLRAHPDIDLPRSVRAALVAVGAIAGVREGMSFEEIDACFARYYEAQPPPRAVLDAVRGFAQSLGLDEQQRASAGLGEKRVLRPLATEPVKGAVQVKPWTRFALNS